MGSIKAGELLWQPSAERIANANITHFTNWLNQRHKLQLSDYDSLWVWSVENSEAFWDAIWQYYQVTPESRPETALACAAMPGAQWFPGSRLNFAEHLLKQGADTDIAIYHESEAREPGTVSWAQLRQQVAALATQLRKLGVEPGDRVATYLPTTPEAVVVLLACAAVGAVWSSCSPDFGSKAVLERFSQIQPKVLFAVGGYRFGGRDFDRRDELRQIVERLPCLNQVVYLPFLDAGQPAPPVDNALLWQDALTADSADFRFEQLPFEHPLWILYTSGTTGLPKGIVHGHGGVLLEFIKASWLQDDLKPESVKFFYTTTGWTMFNLLTGGLVTGCALVLYDGSPTWPDIDQLWRLAERYRVSYFGSNPVYISRLQQEGFKPADKFDVSSIRSVALTGSPATPETFAWLYQHVHSDLHVVSMSGGTDVAAPFVGGAPTLPVHAGEIQAPCLGVAACAFDDNGEEIVDEEGELVVTQPIPSMPLYLWNDPDFERYRDSYFDMFPGIWRQGDLIRFTARRSCIISGRSDATLNRHGVRIGTAEIYRTVEAMDEVIDSLIVNIERADGSSFMPLFVVLQDGVELGETLCERIRKTLAQSCSPRHVPEVIHRVDAIPYTLSGKKLEVPVKKLLMGKPEERAVNTGAVANPEALAFFRALAEELNKGGCQTWD